MEWVALLVSMPFMITITVVITLWMSGAFYYDVGREAKWARMLVVAWLAAAAATFLVWQPMWQPFVVLLGFFTVFLGWWLSLRPSNDRNWEPNSAVLPRVSRDGDAILIQNVRNTEYRTATDYTPRYEDRMYHLSGLRGAECLMFYWGSPWMSHPISVFDFGDEGRVCISIEVRYRVGQKYSVFRSLYRQQEMIYIVADERDVILRRTKYAENNDGYLYRLNADIEEVRRVFLDYMDVINELHEKPRWYHGLFANCTTTVYRQRHTQVPCDWRILVNGQLDRSMYERGRLDRSQPFEVLKRESWINEIANNAPREDFGDHVRRELKLRRSDGRLAPVADDA